MVKKILKPSQKLLEEWPALFEEMSADALPLKYIDSVILKFIDGREWEIDVLTNFPHVSLQDAYLKLDEILLEYEDEMQHIAFNLNVEEIKKDMNRSLNKLI